MIDKFEIKALKDYLETNSESELKIARSFLEDIISIFEKAGNYDDQIKELRDLAEDAKCENEEDDIVRALQAAACTIETLSAKLHYPEIRKQFMQSHGK